MSIVSHRLRLVVATVWVAVWSAAAALLGFAETGDWERLATVVAGVIPVTLLFPERFYGPRPDKRD
jgi:low affinity Fe/Cu permease